MLPAYRKTSEDDKYQMKTIRKSGIPTSCIYDFFATQIGGYENIGYSRRDMYNEKFKGIKVKSFITNDALDFLNGMCDNDYMMYLRHTVNENCMLQHPFWCDGVCCTDYSLFRYMLALDATYRKITYNTPLVIFSGVKHHNQSIIFGNVIEVIKLKKIVCGFEEFR